MIVARIALSVLLCSALGEQCVAGNIDFGQAEYLTACASCHGVYGQGDGTDSERFDPSPTDLSRLAQDNGGSYPYWRVYAVIDGRYQDSAHGTRDMPVWGDRYSESDKRRFGANGGEAFTRDRIKALADFVRTLQR